MRYSTAPHNPHFLGGEAIFPEGTAEMLRPLDREAREQAPSLFGSARLSQTPELYGFRLLRRTLGATPLRALLPEQYRIYHRWLNLTNEEAELAGQLADPVPEAYHRSLVAAGDPAIFVIDRMEHIRSRDFPSLHREPGRLETAHSSYDMLLRSVLQGTEPAHDSYELLLRSIHGQAVLRDAEAGQLDPAAA